MCPAAARRLDRRAAGWTIRTDRPRPGADDLVVLRADRGPMARNGRTHGRRALRSATCWRSPSVHLSKTSVVWGESELPVATTFSNRSSIRCASLAARFSPTDAAEPLILCAVPSRLFRSPPLAAAFQGQQSAGQGVQRRLGLVDEHGQVVVRDVVFILDPSNGSDCCGRGRARRRGRGSAGFLTGRRSQGPLRIGLGRLLLLAPAVCSIRRIASRTASQSTGSPPGSFNRPTMAVS